MGKIKHDRANLVSVQVRESENAKTRAKVEVGIEQRKFERVYELLREPNDEFSITYAPSADLDVTNVVVGEVLCRCFGEDWGVIGAG